MFHTRSDVKNENQHLENKSNSPSDEKNVGEISSFGMQGIILQQLKTLRASDTQSSWD